MTTRPTQFYDAYVFDLDGTVYLGDVLLPNAQRAITAIRTQGKRTMFLSNNPTRTRQECASKLTKLGLPTAANDIITSSMVMVDFLKRHVPNARLFVIGEQPLYNDLRDAGFKFAGSFDEIDVVIASFDRTFTYAKLQIAFDAIRHGARLLVILVTDLTQRRSILPSARRRPTRCSRYHRRHRSLHQHEMRSHRRQTVDLHGGRRTKSAAPAAEPLSHRRRSIGDRRANGPQRGHGYGSHTDGRNEDRRC